MATSQPRKLIDRSKFFIDYPGCKFLNVGLDPTNDFSVMAVMATASSHVYMSHTFLCGIFSMLDRILSTEMDRAKDLEIFTFMDTATMSLSTVKRNDESVLIVESKTEAECRVELTSKDVKKLREFELPVLKAAMEKSTISRPAVLRQFDEICNQVNEAYGHRPKCVIGLKTFIKKLNMNNESSTKRYVMQLQLYARQQIAERVMTMSTVASK